MAIILYFGMAIICLRFVLTLSRCTYGHWITFQEPYYDRVTRKVYCEEHFPDAN